MSDLVHQTQPSAGVSTTLSVARMRWRRALTDLRSRLDGGGDNDLTYKVVLFSAVLFGDLVFVIAIFSR
jgi:hypothetical protein